MRSVEEIQAEMDGADKRSRGYVQLLKEMVEAQRTEIARLNGFTTTEGAPLPRVEAPALEFSQDESALESPEWHFIEKCIAEMDVNIKSTILSKFIFQNLDRQVKNWRAARAIIQRLGPGAQWPQFQALGLKDGDGSPKHEHSILSSDWIPFYNPDAEPEEPAPEPGEQQEIPLVTEGGMPVRSAQKPSPEQVLAHQGGAPLGVAPAPVPAGSIAEDILGDIASRPDRPDEKAAVTEEPVASET